MVIILNNAYRGRKQFSSDYLIQPFGLSITTCPLSRIYHVSTHQVPPPPTWASAVLLKWNQINFQGVYCS